MTRLSEMLRLYMAVKHISQRELAAEIKVSASTVNRLLDDKEIQQSHFIELLNWLMKSQKE